MHQKIVLQLEQQLKLMNSLAPTVSPLSFQSSTIATPSVDGIDDITVEFHYGPEDNVAFNARLGWLRTNSTLISLGS